MQSLPNDFDADLVLGGQFGEWPAFDVRGEQQLGVSFRDSAPLTTISGARA